MFSSKRVNPCVSCPACASTWHWASAVVMPYRAMICGARADSAVTNTALARGKQAFITAAVVAIRPPSNAVHRCGIKPLDFDRGQAGHADRAGPRRGQVDHAAAHERAAIIDAHHP